MNWIVYGWCTLGIAISVLLPVLWEAVYRYFPRPQLAGPANVNNVPPALVAFWRVVAPYFLLGLASAVTALLIVVLSGDMLSDHRAALLAGYTWDSTLQKLRR